MNREMGRPTGCIRLVQAVYSLGIGGSETLAMQLAGALNRDGRYACSLYGVDHGGPLTEALAADGIPYRVFSRKRGLDWRLLGQLARQFREDKVQLVHTHHLGQLLLAGIAARLAGAAVVHTEHEFYTLGRRRHQQILRLLSLFAGTVTTVAAPVTEFLTQRVGIPMWKIKTIPNGVDVTRFQLARPINRSELGWNGGNIVVGCVARLDPGKGHAVLLDAFHRVLGRQPQARLLLIGDGGERSRLAAQAEALGVNGSVRFLGSRADVPRLLAACDVVTLASICEGLPLSILEAMAAGKPVVATRVGCVPQVVQDGLTGLLVPPGDAAALAESLESLVRDEGTRRRLGMQACRLMQSGYSFARTLEQYEAVYETAMTGRR
jgi:glycosyltransferase involved in cell wall biosynthesis